LEETVELVVQLRDEGASLIAIHAHYHASFQRKGPGAQDGPALLDQVMEIQKAVLGVVIVANANMITHDDLKKNVTLMHAIGIMSTKSWTIQPCFSHE
jgi:tRNA-dihydrouridine synthase